jgi:hypothetical protein
MSVMKKCFSLSFFLFFVSTGYAQSIPSNAPMESLLASLDAGRYIKPSDPRVNRYRVLLQQLGKTYFENVRQICDLTIDIREELKRKRINQKLLPILEGMNTLFGKKKGFKYARYSAAYLAVRARSQSNNAAFSQLRAHIKTLTYP